MKSHATTEMPAESLVKQEIRRSGPMTFHQFVELSLYHPVYGYYSQPSSPRGRAGDYFTSVQASALFPQIFSDGLRHLRETLGADQFSLIEIGSGDGEFLEGILKELESKKELKGLRVWAVEQSRSARDRVWRRLSRFPRCAVVPSLDDIEWMGTLEGCVVSNELFDALPFHRLKRSGNEWKEIYVALQGDELIEKEGPVSEKRLLERLSVDDIEFIDGQEIEVRSQAEDFYQQCGALLSRGSIVTIDYGYPRWQLYDPTRPKGTWQCFRKHAINTRPFEEIGRQDITAHVDFTELVEAGRKSGFEPALFSSQGNFLSHIGAERLDKFLKAEAGSGDTGRSDSRNVERSPVSPDPALSRIGQVQQLIHPQAMGGAFWTLVQTKGVDVPPAFQAIPSRVKRLLPSPKT